MDYFNQSIQPHLNHRVPAFQEGTKVRGGWNGLYDVCTHDNQPLIGRDPYYYSIIWATGFNGHGAQMAPAVGRAIQELVYDENYRTIDLNAFGFNRIINGKRLNERCVAI